MNYRGVIIEESLGDKSILNKVRIAETDVESVTKKHKTPWLSKWTLHKVEISEDEAEKIAEEMSRAFDSKHLNSWYADFKNDKFHFIVFPNKIFKVDLPNPALYQKAKEYGISQGIPEYQVGFV